MNLLLNTILAEQYRSQSQKIRVMTESWVSNSIFCPSCGNKVSNYINNKPVADFYCKRCTEDFELKSKKGKIPKTILAGAYSQIIQRIISPTNPNFFFMAYHESLSVNNFFVIPKHFFIPKIIKKRNPLKQTARRAGWVGSNILLSKIPKAGYIFYVENGKEISKRKILEKWQKTTFLKTIKKPDMKGWILDIMNCIDMLNKKSFNLSDIYKFEPVLKKKHPNNNNIQAKIRQQLQFLRDKGYLKFTSIGKYELT